MIRLRDSIRLAALLAVGLLLAGAPAGALAQERTPPRTAAEEEEEFRRFEEDLYGGTETELTAAQALAELERRRRGRDRAARRGIVNVKSFEYTLEGPDEETLMKEASLRALKSTVGRVYFGDYLLLGRDLLDPYLRNYGDRFIVRRNFIENRMLADGGRRVRVKIGVDVDRLYSDLEEKHFLAEPKIRPTVGVFIRQTIDGQASVAGRGRKRIEEFLRRNELRVVTDRMEAYDLDVNVSDDPKTLLAAREEAQRWDIDIIVTGSLDINTKPNKVILYDQLFFNAASLDLKLIRVDTGEAMRVGADKYSAYGRSPEDALGKTLGVMIPRVGGPLVDKFLDEWSNVMLDRADYRLLFNGVTPTQLELISNTLRTLSPQVELYVKSHYGDVAVVNMFFPSAQPGQVERFLRRSRLPQFNVRVADESHLEVDVF